MEPDEWTRRVREGLGEHEQERSASSRYELLDELGRGGMGIVHRARDRKLNRIVALKFLQSTDARDAKRFEREGRMAAQLSHPHIIPIHEVGEVEGKPFIAMEFVQGKPLGGMRLDPRQAAAIVRDAAEAVHYAHGQGVVHRDLKPGNLLLGDDGHLWVMDFGLARPVEHGQTLTTLGTVIGTPAFMAPEQAAGGRCDARSDVYSLGATLYYLLTHKAPFEGKDGLDVLEKVRKGEFVPPRRANPSIPRDLETVVLKAMAKARWSRYETARELADDLERYLDGEPVEARPVSLFARVAGHVRKHKAMFTGLSVAVACGCAIASYTLYNSWRRATRLKRVLAEASQARNVREWGRAASLYAEAQRLSPNDATVYAKRRAMEEMDLAARSWAAAKAFEEYARTTELPAVTAYEPPSVKETRWMAEDRLEGEENEHYRQVRRAEQSAWLALGFDPTLEEARDLLIKMYTEAYRDALRMHQPDQIHQMGEELLKHGGPEAVRKAHLSGTIALTTEPPGVEAFLFRYEERKRRLIPLPCSAAGEVREVDCPSVDPLPWDASEDEKRRVRRSTAYPLEPTSFNEVTFPLSVPAGSYIVLVRKPGYVELRYPVLIDGEDRVVTTVRLIRPSAIPEGFVHIPAGRFIVGGDPAAATISKERWTEGTRAVPGFLLSRFPVTCGSYREFLNDRGYQSTEAAILRQPRTDQGSVYWVRNDAVFALGHWSPDEPVLGVSGKDAIAFADWYTKRHGQGKWTFRLPTEDEWQRAARGADRRCFPWGDRFDFAFFATGKSRATPPEARPSLQEPIGLFPADESPFGVRDLAGPIATWIQPESEKPYAWICKGGHYDESPVWSRICSQAWIGLGLPTPYSGIRLAADLPKDDE